jgi:hypothetical protein
MAVSKLPVRSCLIDGEAVVYDENGLAVFELIRRDGLRAPTAGHPHARVRVCQARDEALLGSSMTSFFDLVGLQVLKITPPPFGVPPLDRSEPAAERIEQYDHRQPHCIDSG